MKWNDIFKIACWSGMLLATASCGKEWAVSEEAGKEHPSGIMLHIGTPWSGEVEYTRATQDASEVAINSLTVYDFLLKPHSGDVGADTLVEGVQYLVKQTGVTTPEPGCFVSTATGAQVNLSLPATVGSRHVFVCVANEAEKTRFDSIMQPGVTPIDVLRKTSSTRQLKNDESTARLMEQGAVMTGMTGAVTIEQNASYNVKLCRIMARVDVEHHLKASYGVKIMSVSAENCAATGFLFGQGSDKSFTAEKNNYSALVRQTQNTAVAEVLPNLTYGGVCGKVLYLYEHRKDSCGKSTPEPTLLVKYVLNGSESVVRVPMKLATGRFDIQRNRLYKLVVGMDENAAKTRIVCTLNEEEKEKKDEK